MTVPLARVDQGAGAAGLQRGGGWVDSFPFLSLLPPLLSKLGAGPGSSDWLGAGLPAPPLQEAGFLPTLHQDGIKGAQASRRSRPEFLLGTEQEARGVRTRMSRS